MPNVRFKKLYTSKFFIKHSCIIKNAEASYHTHRYSLSVKGTVLSVLSEIYSLACQFNTIMEWTLEG